VTNLIEGYKGDEIVEVEVARKEEREQAEAEKSELMEQAEAEKVELLRAEKIENAQKMIEDGLSIEMIERYTGLSAEEIKLLDSNKL